MRDLDVHSHHIPDKGRVLEMNLLRLMSVLAAVVAGRSAVDCERGMSTVVLLNNLIMTAVMATTV